MADFICESHPNKMLESHCRLWLRKELCDVIICCGGKEIPCHRIVLASFSSYFEAMFTTGMVESRQEKVDMVDVDPQAMEMLVRYAYTSEVVISMENVQVLLATANLLNVPAVQEACCRCMQSHMDENNCVGIHRFAETYSCTTLMERSMDFIVEHFSVVYQQEEFPSLSVEKLTEILASDHLNVTEEETVFEAAMLWLNHSPDRKQSFEKVMEHVRLALLNPYYLDGVKASLGVVESQVCQRLTTEARGARPRWSKVLCEVILMVASDSIETFHPLANRWQTLSSLPSAVRNPGLVVSASTVYLAGGRLPDPNHQTSTHPTREMWRYDSSGDSWLEMAPMIKKRSEFSLVILDGYVFAVGGSGNPRSVERYDPNSNTWQLMESNGMPHCWPCAVVALDGLIYVIGVGQDQMFKYNPVTGVWTEAAPMGGHRSNPSACVLNKKIYAIGGYDRTGCVLSDQVQRYNPDTNQWIMCAPMKKRRYFPGVAVANGKIYVLGGSGDHCIESFNDETDTWDMVGEMASTHTPYSCASLRMR